MHLKILLCSIDAYNLLDLVLISTSTVQHLNHFSMPLLALLHYVWTKSWRIAKLLCPYSFSLPPIPQNGLDIINRPTNQPTLNIQCNNHCNLSYVKFNQISLATIGNKAVMMVNDYDNCGPI